MRIAVVQHDIVWENPAENFAKLRSQVDDAVEQGAQLIALAELFSWGFSIATGLVNEGPDGPSTRFLRDEAARIGSWIAGSIPVQELGNDMPFNRMTFAGPGGELEIYDKIHPFTYGGEDKGYRAGNQLQTFTIGDLRISPFVCYDLRFADEFWALANETDCYVVVANWPAARRDHWMSLLTARAIENQAWVVGANRVGTDPNVSYAGDSRIIDPFGDVVADIGDSVGIICADVDPHRVTEVRSSYPFLPDRR